MTSPGPADPRRARAPASRRGLLALLALVVVGAALAGGLAERAVPDPPPDWPVAVRYEVARGGADPVPADLLARGWDDLLLVEHRERHAHDLLRRRDHGLQRSGQRASEGPGEPFALLADVEGVATQPIQRYETGMDLPAPLAPAVSDRRGEVTAADAEPDDANLAAKVAERLGLPEHAVRAQRFTRAACPARTLEGCAADEQQAILRVELAELSLPLLVRESGAGERWELRARALEHGDAVDAAPLDGV